MFIQSVDVRDARFQLVPGQGSDAVHSTPQYSFAVALLTLDSGLQGTGIVLTMGVGNDLVCDAISMLAQSLVGVDLEELMAGFVARFRQMADDPYLRWLGPHKGVVHLALASITNACFDLWAKVRQKPLWNSLLDLSPEAFVNLLDLSYLEDVLDHETALQMLCDEQRYRESRLMFLLADIPATIRVSAGISTTIGRFAKVWSTVLARVSGLSSSRWAARSSGTGTALNSFAAWLARKR